MSNPSFEEFSATNEWIKKFEHIMCQKIEDADESDLIFLEEEYNNLDGNQPSLSLIKNNVTYDNFIWCNEKCIWLLSNNHHGSFNLDDKIYICTSETHDENLMCNDLEIHI